MYYKDIIKGGNKMYSPWCRYEGRSIGRIIHYLYHYCGLTVAEVVQIGDGRVTYRNKPFATYTWSEDEIPVFVFVGENAEHYQREHDLKMNFVDKTYAEYAEHLRELGLLIDV